MQFTVIGHRMSLQQAAEAVTPDAFCEAQFVFDNTWRYSSVWAYLEGNGVALRMKIENGSITTDHVTELTAGNWDVYLKGESYNENGTLREEKITNICRFTVAEAENGERCRFRTIATPTSEEQTKFLALQALDLAKEVMRMALAGEFKGDPGETGAVGPQGPKGDTGATGSQGLKGSDGSMWYFGYDDPPSPHDMDLKEHDVYLDLTSCNLFVVEYGDWIYAGNIKGADGHTPVRGTDYWTAADIATIKDYIDDVIQEGT